MLNKIYEHLFGRSYMSGVEREKTRVKATGEVFTPTPLVEEILDNLDPDVFKDPSKNFLDNSCGDGQFLASVLYRKLENNIDFETALRSIYGTDLMIDNVDLCRDRLLCGQEHLRHIVEQNIQCRDGLKFSYNFEPLGPARRRNEEAARKRQRKLDNIRQKEEIKKQRKEKQDKIHKKLFGETIT